MLETVERTIVQLYGVSRKYKTDPFVVSELGRLQDAITKGSTSFYPAGKKTNVVINNDRNKFNKEPLDQDQDDPKRVIELGK